MSQWFWLKDGEKQGPFNSEQLKQMIEFGEVRDDDLLWREGMKEWQSLAVIQGKAPKPAAAKPEEPEPRKVEPQKIEPQPQAIREPEKPERPRIPVPGFSGGARPDSPTYVHSGQAPLISVLWVLGLAMLLGLLAGGLYGVGCFYNPFIYINFLGSILAAAGVGFAVVYLGKAGHIRSSAAMTLIALGGGVLALLGNWAAWTWAIGDVWIWRPDLIWTLMCEVAQEGYWSIGSSGSPVSGVFLWIIWIIEAGILVLGPTLIALGLSTENVYCETCRRWAAKKTLPPFVSHPKLIQALPTMTGEDLSLLEKLQPAGKDVLLEKIGKKAGVKKVARTTQYLEITTWTCGGNCPEVMSISHVMEKMNPKGETEKESQTLLERLYVPVGTERTLRRIAQSA